MKLKLTIKNADGASQIVTADTIHIESNDNQQMPAQLVLSKAAIKNYQERENNALNILNTFAPKYAVSGSNIETIKQEHLRELNANNEKHQAIHNDLFKKGVLYENVSPGAMQVTETVATPITEPVTVPVATQLAVTGAATGAAPDAGTGAQSIAAPGAGTGTVPVAGTGALPGDEVKQTGGSSRKRRNKKTKRTRKYRRIRKRSSKR
jgi:hypothetical protein